MSTTYQLRAIPLYQVRFTLPSTHKLDAPHHGSKHHRGSHLSLLEPLRSEHCAILPTQAPSTNQSFLPSIFIATAIIASSTGKEAQSRTSEDEVVIGRLCLFSAVLQASLVRYLLIEKERPSDRSWPGNDRVGHFREARFQGRCDPHDTQG